MTGSKEHRLSVKMEDMKAPQLLNPVSFKVLDGTKYTLNTFLLRRLWLQMTKAQDGRFPIQDIVASFLYNRRKWTRVIHVEI